MSINVEVGLLSGRKASLTIDLNEQVGVLKLRAQVALGVGKGRLVDSSGSGLDEEILIQNTVLQNGASLMLHIKQVQACANDHSFAAILSDGSVVTWGILPAVVTVVLCRIS